MGRRSSHGRRGGPRGHRRCFIARGILGISVLAPKAASNFGNSSTAVYAALAAGFALLATALLHVLLLGAPRPLAFFVWITALADLAVAAAPFTQPAPLASKVFTAVINVVVGIAVISLLSGVGRSAVRPARDRVQAPAPLNRRLPAAHRVSGTGPPRPAEGGTLGLDQAAPDAVPPDGPVPHRELQAFSAYRADSAQG